MIVPYDHSTGCTSCRSRRAIEMMALAQHLESRSHDLYRPDGVNIGMNIGKAAGAGIAGHIHMHALPRWVADANFMTVIGETRVLPELLETTYRAAEGKILAGGGQLSANFRGSLLCPDISRR